METIEAAPWRYSTLHTPGLYLDRESRRSVFWSGAPRWITTSEQAEWNAAAQMRALGYFDAEVTVRGADGGIDVHSRQALAQVKRTGVLTGRPELQCLVGAAPHDNKKELWFFSASGYSRLAIEYADEHLLILFTYLITGDLEPVNQLAIEKYTRLLAKREKHRERRSKSSMMIKEKWFQLREAS